MHEVTCEYCYGAGEHYDALERSHQQCLMCRGTGMMPDPDPHIPDPEESDDQEPWY